MEGNKNTPFIAFEHESISLDRFYKNGEYFTIYNPILENFKAWHNAGYTGKGVKTCVLDSGIMTHHPLIENHVEEAVDFTDEGIEDLSGHGTMVTLISIESAPGAKLYIGKVLNENNIGFEKNIIAGIEWAMKKEVNILNLSFGQIQECTPNCELKNVLDKAKDKNITIFAAAGNNPNYSHCPAKCCISVGSLNKTNDNIAEYSSKADFYASDFIALIPLKK